FDVKFQAENNEWEYVWATSWGVSTRLIGALIMTHGDDDGIVIPPKLAAYQVLAMPIMRKNDDNSAVLSAIEALIKDIKALGVTVKIDDRQNVSPGFKFAEADLVGYPVRIELGPRDLENKQVVVTKRHNHEKVVLPLDKAAAELPRILETIQRELFDRAQARITENTKELNSYDEFKDYMAADEGFALVHWAGDMEDEKRVQEETKATHRVIPIEGAKEKGKCMLTGKESGQRVIFAKAY
ncbi:proline--tRNA ligase, partial [bacterium]|nr:proline--tRNA ligase [bacterium]